MVRPERVELSTFSLGMKCSIHLSYGRTSKFSRSAPSGTIFARLQGAGKQVRRKEVRSFDVESALCADQSSHRLDATRKCQLEFKTGSEFSR